MLATRRTTPQRPFPLRKPPFPNTRDAPPQTAPYSGAPSSPPEPDGEGDGAGVDGPGDRGGGVDGAGVVGTGDRGDTRHDGVGSGGGGGGSFASGTHANSTPISNPSTSSTAANPTTAPTRLRSGGRSPTGTGPPPTTSRGRSNAGSPDPSQYGWNCGPRRRPPHHPRPDPWNTTGSRNRSAPARSASYSVATHGAGPSGCAATTGASPGPPAPAARPGPGTAALIAARNRSRAAASPAAPRFSTATLARRPSPSTPRNTIPAADSDRRADRRNGPNWAGSPGGNGLDMAATLTTTPYDRPREHPRRTPEPITRHTHVSPANGYK